MTEAESSLSTETLAELRWAYQRLEHPSLAARISDTLATPLDRGLHLLPRGWERRVRAAAEASIRGALQVALSTVDPADPAPPQVLTHRLLATGAGAVSGFFGPVAVLAELPVTTVLMLRAIAEEARREGEDLTTLGARLACVQVFGLGARARTDDDAEIGYYGVRLSLGLHFRGVTPFGGGGGGHNVPAVINLVRAVAARFGVVVSDKVALQLVPIAGALAGGTLNFLFMRHYQDVARGHFIVRRLERELGPERIHREYLRLQAAEREARRSSSPLEGW